VLLVTLMRVAGSISLAWKAYENSNYAEALDAVKHIDLALSTDIQLLLMKLFQGNCHVHLVSHVISCALSELCDVMCI
jgi:hypothetical protein